jgi:CTP:molybdopterin cytidylyltransferase MocA
MPLLTAAHYRAVINRHQQMDAPVITLPHNGKLAGHPKLFSAQFRTAILNLEGNAQQGARRVIQDNKDHINRFATTDLAYFFDVDTPAAYQELLALE